MILRSAAILLLVLANAFFVAAEFALVRARRSRLEARAREGSRASTWALRAMSATPRMLSTSQLGITLSSLGLGVLLAVTAQDLATDGSTVGLILRVAAALIVVAYLHLVLGELVPRTLALSQPERILRALALPLLAFAWVTRPFGVLLGWSAQRLTRRWRASVPEEDAVHSPDELRLLVERSEEGGALEERDAAMLEAVFEFSTKTVREVMTPRTEIIALELGATLEATLALIEEHELSRYPVYERTIDNIVGLLLAKDLIGVMHGRRDSFELRTLTRPVHFVPWTKEVDSVLADFKRLKVHMAIVLDEYGGTAGVVTMEDLLEELVGEISDESDEAEPPQDEARSGELIIPGDMSIGELNERLGLAVPMTEYTTVGGFIFGSLGRVPHPGASVTAGGASFTVRKMDGRRVASVAVERARTGVPESDDTARRRA